MKTPTVIAIETLMLGLSISELNEINKSLTECLGKKNERTLNQRVKKKQEQLRPGILKSLYKKNN